MDIQAYNDHYLAQEEVTTTVPFDQKTLVYNVMGRIPTLADIDVFERIYLKCDLATAIQPRELYAQIVAGNRMNKRHWNTVHTNVPIPDTQMLSRDRR